MRGPGEKTTGSESTRAGVCGVPHGLVKTREQGEGAGSFRGFICHFHLRKSVAGFAVDWLASCLLYIGHADFTLSKIRSSCRWSVSLVRKEKKKKNHAKSFRRY